MAHLRRSLVVAAVAALFPSAHSAAHADPGANDDLASLVAAFETHTGAQLVFTSDEVPADGRFDVMLELDAERRREATRILIDEARRYPRGWLGAIGLSTVGVFDGLASSRGDGYRPWVDRLGGYRYFGQWNGADTVVAAFYTDEQLPLTFHHEVFHHVDATDGAARSDDAFTADDARFAAAVAGEAPYAAPAIAPDDLAALRRLGDGVVLEDVVSDYTSKSPGEDQAETARHLMSSLPDALVQIATRPGLAGSQRLLHVIDQYARASADGPDVAWLTDVALGRDPDAGRAVRRFAATAADHEAALRARLAARDGDAAFTVWGREDARGVNQTLRGDIARFGKVARALRRAAQATPGSGPALAEALAADLRLLARYRRFIASRWTISAGTERAFTRARAALVAGIAEGDAAAGARLKKLRWDALADLTAGGGAVAAEPVERDNPYLHKVDDEIEDAALRAAIRRVQPAAVRLGGGSGVNLTAAGMILTAAHVVDEEGKTLQVAFPDGTEVTAVVIAIDHTLDLAVLDVTAGGGALPWAPIADAAPAVGTTVVAIGQPGTWTPDGEPTGYQPWHVSVGEIRGFRGDALDDQSLGGTKHDAWTYWGHSGSPLYDDRGRIVALHNSWDSTTAMRHAVRHEAIVHFLAAHDVAYTAR